MSLHKYINKHLSTFGIFNIILVIVLCLTLLSYTFFKVINQNFQDVPSMLSFLSKAHVYNNVSQLVKLEIQNNYPKPIRNNFLLYGLANQLVNAVVTPSLIAQVTKPALQLSVAFAKSPTSIVNNKVVVATAPYKQQAAGTLQKFGLPKFLVVNAQLLLDSVPKQLVLVDLQKRPNSVLGLIIKARTLLQNNQMALGISWSVLLGVVAVIVVYNLRHLNNMLKALFIGFGAVGIIVVTLYFLMPWILSTALSNTSTEILVVQNQLISDIVTYLVLQMRNISLYYIAFGVVTFMVWRFVPLEHVQAKLDKILHKLHFPKVSVKIK